MASRKLLKQIDTQMDLVDRKKVQCKQHFDNLVRDMVQLQTELNAYRNLEPDAAIQAETEADLHTEFNQLFESRKAQLQGVMDFMALVRSTVDGEARDRAYICDWLKT